MEIIKSKKISLKQIFNENWNAFVKTCTSSIAWYAVYNVWKIINCREPNGLGFRTFACPVHSNQICHVPNSWKSRFCSVCAKVQIDKWVADMNRLFPNCPYYHITFTVPSQFRTLLFNHRKPCPEGKVRVQWLCHLNKKLLLQGWVAFQTTKAKE